MTHRRAGKVLFIAPHPIEGPSTRFRICQFLPALEQADIGWDLRPFLSSRMAPVAYRPGGVGAKLAVTAWGAASRIADVVRASRADLVWVLREAFPVGPPLLERALDAACGRLAFDFDDAIWVPATNFANPLDRLRDWDRPAKIIARADRVIAGSRLLAEYARAHAAPERVSILPTVVDTARFRPSPRAPDGTVVVGWIGTPRNTSYLQAVWPALAEAARATPALRYVLVGAEPFDTADVPVRFVPWTLAGEIADIQGFDIGIMPLADDAQARGKCGFKIIEYMACGVPAVASPVGANPDVLADGITGRLAADHAGWLAALTELARDSALRHAMGQAARARAVEQFSTDAVAPRFVGLVREAMRA